MPSTIVLITSFAALLVVSMTFSALFLYLGLRWVKADRLTIARLTLATIAIAAVQIAVGLMFRLISAGNLTTALVVLVATYAAHITVACLVIRWFFATSIRKSLLALLPMFIASIGIAPFAAIAFRSLVYEAFTTPTNAMAPTLLGKHRRGVCPKCGQPTYCTPAERYGEPNLPDSVICDNFHITETVDFDGPAMAGDRFVVAKFLTPRRWDPIVFRYPEDPSTLYVMRLVGLPGERIHIEDGAVWSDGKRLTSPESLKEIEFSSAPPEWYGEAWGSKDRPAILADDEYFVLGDFSARSADSRLWRIGALNHHPYAVPKGNLYGVVTHIYWPPERWRTLR